MADKTARCRTCGNLFERGRRKAFCSDACAKRYDYAYGKVKEAREESEDGLSISPGKQHLSLEDAARMAAEAGKTYGEMFAPEVVVNIPDWAKY